jgi:omega-hydroxy-beta-dihydromenaquinone-9 sulfotransferase
MPESATKSGRETSLGRATSGYVKTESGRHPSNHSAMFLGAKPKEAKIEVNPYQFWVARFWHGMLLSAWLRLLWRNGFRVSITRLPLAMTISCATVFNSMLRPLQELICKRYLSRTQIKDAPIFIIGHWRSGTTMLHELMVLDARYAFPTTYECLAPNHFLISSMVITKLKFLLPARRPMDDMEAGWDKPQEDEFALVNMGMPSPYLTMAFPNEPPQSPGSLTLEGLSSDELAKWKSALEWFLTRVTLRSHKRIILKSPPHTARIKVLLELFPNARFVHIVRDPYALYGSTIKLWKTLYKFQALQEPRHEGLEEYVFSCFEQMYEKFDRERSLIDPSRLFEVRYEDLVKDPIAQMQALYEHLGLGEFETAIPKLHAYFKDRKDYRTGSYQIPDDLRETIDRRWGPFMRRFGYCGGQAAAQAEGTPSEAR